MKKNIPISIVIILLVGLVGCSSGNREEEERLGLEASYRGWALRVREDINDAMIEFARPIASLENGTATYAQTSTALESASRELSKVCMTVLEYSEVPEVYAGDHEILVAMCENYLQVCEILPTAAKTLNTTEIYIAGNYMSSGTAFYDEWIPLVEKYADTNDIGTPDSPSQ